VLVANWSRQLKGRRQLLRSLPKAGAPSTSSQMNRKTPSYAATRVGVLERALKPKQFHSRSVIEAMCVSIVCDPLRSSPPAMCISRRELTRSGSSSSCRSGSSPFGTVEGSSGSTGNRSDSEKRNEALDNRVYARAAPGSWAPTAEAEREMLHLFRG
jgi:hypothetical protein